MKKLVITTLTLAVISSAASAEQMKLKHNESMSDTMYYISVEPEISTLGYGATAKLNMTNDLSFGLSFNNANLDTTQDIDGISYDLKANLNSFGPELEYHPFSNNISIFGGVRINKNTLDMTASPELTGTIRIGNTNYDVSEIVDIEGEVEFNKYSPLVGIGYNKSLGENFSFGGKIGVMYHGSPSLSLTANGSIADEPAFQEELDKEATELRDSLSEFKYYPVASFGVEWRF